MKLNLGAGGDIRPKGDGWVNIDIRPLSGIDLVLNLEKEKLPYDDNSVDYVMAKDIIEHFGWRETNRILKELHRVLKSGCQIYVQCPNIDAIIDMYAKRAKNFMDYMPELLPSQKFSYWMFGGQEYTENVHKAGFNIPDLRKLLEGAGFEVLNIQGDGGTNIICCAAKR